MISVRKTGDSVPLTFKVELDGTAFEVSLTRSDADRLGAGRSETDVVAAAFRFLLDREPAEAILRSFEISVISRYFPDFERELPEYLGLIERNEGGT